METEIKKPLCLELEDARAEIFASINLTAKKHNIPFYLLESIVADAYRQVTAFAKQEREMAVKEYTSNLNKDDKKV